MKFADQSTIYYLCYGYNQPWEEQKLSYQHVGNLNQNGQPAFVVHFGKYRPMFCHEADVISLQSLRARFDINRDWVVVPDSLGHMMTDIPGKKVLLSVKIENLLRPYGNQINAQYPHYDCSINGIFCTSEIEMAILKSLFPDIRIMVVPWQVSNRLFRYKPLKSKKRRVVIVPENIDSLYVMFHTIQSRCKKGLNPFKDIEWTLLSHKSENKRSALILDSLIFVSLAIEERTTYMMLEALASGCFPISYSDLLKTKLNLPTNLQCDRGNILSVIKTLENVLHYMTDAPEIIERVIQQGQDCARSFSEKQQAQALLSAWGEMFQNVSYT